MRKEGTARGENVRGQSVGCVIEDEVDMEKESDEEDIPRS